MYREAQRKRICPWHAEEQQHLSLHSQFQAHEGPSRLSRRYKAASVLFSMSLTMTQHHSAVAYMLAHPTCGGLLYPPYPVIRFCAVLLLIRWCTCIKGAKVFASLRCAVSEASSPDNARVLFLGAHPAPSHQPYMTSSHQRAA